MRARLFRIAVLLAALCLLLSSCIPLRAYRAPRAGEVYIHFINVGQGDAALIRTREVTVLVDTGERGEGAEPAVLSYLRRFSLERIDLLVLTHPHADHIGGAVSILEEYEVAACLLPAAVTETATCCATVAALREEGCDVIRAEAGVSLTRGDITLDVLSPFLLPLEDENANSAVLRLTCGESTVLMMGDATAETEDALLAAYGAAALDADALKVAHHGSKYSTTEAFLEAVTPAHAVISCGARNDYGFPTPETVGRLLAAGCTLHRTDTDGSVVLHLEGGVITPYK